MHGGWKYTLYPDRYTDIDGSFQPIEKSVVVVQTL
jgi:hypothetical protein